MIRFGCKTESSQVKLSSVDNEQLNFECYLQTLLIVPYCIGKSTHNNFVVYMF